MAIKTRRFYSARKSCSCSMPGVWRAVAYMAGVVVVFHSPRACAHVARTMDINAQYRSLSENAREQWGAVPLLSSQMQEKDAIFGGVQRLEKCLRFAINTYKPKCVVIANSCVAGVIGDDVESVARTMEEEAAIPIVTVECCGFLGAEYYDGYFEVTQKLLDRFVKPCAKDAGSVLLLGDNGGPWGLYASEVTRMLEQFGVHVLGQFPGYVAFDDLPRVAAAEYAIVLGGRGQTHVGLTKAAKQLHELYGTKYLADIYPVGWQETMDWIERVGDLLERRELARAVLVTETAKLEAGLERFLPVTAGKKTVLCIGRILKYFHPGNILQTIKLLQLDLTGIIMLDTYDGEEREQMLEAVRQASDVPVYSTAEGDALLAQADIVLTTHELQSTQSKQIFLPMLPLVGVAGELKMMQGIYQCLCSRLKGGVRYV